MLFLYPVYVFLTFSCWTKLGGVFLFFDTVRFVIPYFGIREDFSSAFQTKKVGFSYHLDGSLAFSSERFRFYGTPDFGNSSYSDTVSFSQCLDGFCFEFSIPKFLYGHNFVNFSDLERFFEVFRDFLQEQSFCDLPSVRDWLLKRVDVCVNLECQNDPIWYLGKLSQGFVYRGQKAVFYDGCVYLPNRNHTVKFYDKSLEAEKNKKHYHCENLDKDISFLRSRNVLRFEEEFRAPYLLRVLNLEKRRSLTLGSFLDSDFYLKYDVWDHIRKYVHTFNVRSKVNSIEDIFTLVSNSFSRKSRPYFKFLSLICSVGYAETKNRYKKQTFSFYKRKLLNIGIDCLRLSEFITDEKIDEFSFQQCQFKIFDYYDDVPF